MHAVIFAAGRGTRMGALTDAQPKPMIPVAGKPILQRTIEALPDAVTDIVIVIGHLQDAIRNADFLKDRRVHFVAQKELTGTYDALLTAKDALGGDTFLAMNGDDIYSKEGLERLLCEKPFAILARPVVRPNRYSHLEVDADGLLRRIVPNRELPDIASLPKTMTYTGACLLDGSFFTLTPACIPVSHTVPGAGEERSLPHTLERHLDKNPVRLVESPLWLPVGTPEELHTAERILAVS